MRTTDVPFAVLRFQYQLARIPLQLIEAQMAAWMGSEAPPRLFYERWLGGLDTTVGNLLGDDPKLEERGGALIERSDALDRAAPLDATATPKQAQADDELKAKRDNAIKDQKDARAAKERQVKEARSAAEQRKRAAAQGAEKRTATAKQQADDVAQRKNSAEAAKREEQAKIAAAEQTATAAAESKLDDAQTTRSDTAGMSAQADQLEQLADVEKQKRQSERAKDA